LDRGGNANDGGGQHNISFGGDVSSIVKAAALLIWWWRSWCCETNALATVGVVVMVLTCAFFNSNGHFDGVG
jgi:hypothetical protein